MASINKHPANFSDTRDLTSDPLGRDEMCCIDIPIEKISPDPAQPRKDLGDIAGLQASIAEHGIIQPLIVSPTDQDTFIIIAGERRYSAARKAGLVTVPLVNTGELTLLQGIIHGGAGHGRLSTIVK